MTRGMPKDKEEIIKQKDMILCAISKTGSDNSVKAFPTTVTMSILKRSTIILMASKLNSTSSIRSLAQNVKVGWKNGRCGKTVYVLDGDGEFRYSFRRAITGANSVFMRKTGLFGLLENHIRIISLTMPQALRLALTAMAARTVADI